MDAAAGGGGDVSQHFEVETSKNLVKSQDDKECPPKRPFERADLLEYERDGIVLLTKTELDGVDVLRPGTLSVYSSSLGVGPVIKWVPDTDVPPELDWPMVDRSRKVTVRPITVELCELKSFRLSEDGNQLTLIQTDGTKHPPLAFLDEGPEELMAVLRRYVVVRQSSSDRNLYLLADARLEALDRSLSQLNLFDRSHTDAVWKFVNDIKKDPYTTALSAFSKITDKLIFSPSDEECRPEEDMAELLQQSLKDMGHIPSGLQVTTGRKEDGEFEVILKRPKLLDNLPQVERNDPLCQLDWELHNNSETGQIIELEELKEKIFRGGVEHEIRNEVWKFLLGYYPWDSTTEQRAEIRAKKVEDYHRMKMQWRSISEDQEDRFSAFKERKCQVEKDVQRTDRTHPYFQGDENPNVQTLQDILMTYVMYDFDLGYVQGMSDLLSPVLFVMDNEVDAFWCFCGFMENVKSNFDFDQGGMKRQLKQLEALFRDLDPEYFSYLDSKDSGNLYFCFRWLLIWFKREFSFLDVMTMWEVIWTGFPCPNFLLLICVTLMESQRTTIMENGFGFNEILKHVNDLSHRIDLDDLLKRSEALWIKIKEIVVNPPEPKHEHQLQHHVAENPRKILGLPLEGPRATSRPVNIQQPQPTSSAASSVEVVNEEEVRYESGLAAFM